MSNDISEAFASAANLAAVLGVMNIQDLDSAWVCKVDECWTFAINGKTDPVKVDLGEDSMGIGALEPFHMAIWFNGWLAGLLTPFSGSICAGEVGNEDNFIKAVNDRIEIERLAKEMVSA